MVNNATPGGLPRSIQDSVLPRKIELPKPPAAQPSQGFDTSHALSPGRVKESTKEDDEFRDFFETDEEDAALDIIKGAAPTFRHSSKDSEIESRLRSSMKMLRQKYPRGGIKAAQFITFDILADAPENYFFRFEEDAREGTIWVQGQLSDRSISDVVAKAQQNPLDQDLQDIAFRQVQNIALEFMEKKYLKGVEKQVVIYMIVTDILGMSRLEPLWRERSIDEILCNGPHDIQVEVGGQLRRVPAVKFRNASHLENLLERLFGMIGKTLSPTTPLLNGRLYDNSRIFATHRVINPAGPNVAIRRHPEKYWTPMDLVEYGSASKELLTDIGNLIYKGCSFMVIGGTSSGKTSLLNAVSGFFDPNQRVLTLEDDLELKLNPTKLLGAAMECKPANPNKPEDLGVTMRDLVKASLRMRPNGIVIGEVRDGAMYDLCQALNTGHWGCSTVHANSPEDGIFRMTSLVAQADLVKGDAIFDMISSAFDFVIMQEAFPEDGSRRITSVSEIDPRPSIGDDGRVTLGVRRLWEFEHEGIGPDGKIKGTWVKKGELSEQRRKLRHLDLTPNKTWEELVEIARIPDKFLPKHTE